MGLVVAAASTTACTHFGSGPGTVLDGTAACAVLDTVLRSSGLHDAVHMEGKATIDVEQYRVRGRFVLSLTPEGDLAFELTSTTLIGGHREDAVFSFFADTLRVLDRERGRYYEAEEVEALVADALGMGVDVAEVVRRASARRPDCRRVSALERRSDSLEGRVDGQDFEVWTEDARLAKAVWPLPLRSGRGRATLETTYVWRSGALSGLTLWVPEERWRIRLLAE